jgi:hypothetical protein
MSAFEKQPGDETGRALAPPLDRRERLAANHLARNDSKEPP